MKVRTEDSHTDYYSSNDLSSDLGEESYPLNLESPLLVMTPNEQGELPSNDQVTVALIMDCPTILVLKGKQYKALTDSGVAIPLIR